MKRSRTFRNGTVCDQERSETLAKSRSRFKNESLYLLQKAFFNEIIKRKYLTCIGFPIKSMIFIDVLVLNINPSMARSLFMLNERKFKFLKLPNACGCKSVKWWLFVIISVFKSGKFRNANILICFKFLQFVITIVCNPVRP